MLKSYHFEGIDFHMTQINLHFNIKIVESKVNSFRFMIKFYQINSELDIDNEFNKFIDDNLTSNLTINANWSGNSQNGMLFSILNDRFNFFIESGKITIIEKAKGITEITFENDFYDKRSFDSLGNIISEKKESNKWDFRRYRILRYHLVQDLKDKLTNLDILDLDSLSIEYKIDKGFLIDFIYSFINKNLVEITSEENKSLLKVKSNLEQILHLLDESITEMEMNLVA